MITIKEGNLFNSEAQVIAHQCNCQGVMGSGVAKEVKDKYPHVYESYRKDYESGLLKPGYVNYTEAKPGQIIASFCGQDKFGSDGKQYTDYNAVKECLFDIALNMSLSELKTIAFPYNVCCGRGGGDWNIIYKMIADIFTDFDVEIWKL